MAYYYPERTYHQLNAVAYPDHSRPLTGMDGVVRAFWERGEQMWDEDMNNSLEWITTWESLHIYNRWWSPRYPWYSPAVSRYVAEADHNAPQSAIDNGNHALIIDYTNPTSPDFYYKPWHGVMAPVLADRVLIGFKTGGGDGGWQGLAMWQEYVDEIELSVFISETRADRIVAMHHVKEPFRLHADCYSGRVRGWTKYGALTILKNGVAVGFAAQYEESSAVRAYSGLPVTFDAGDVLAIKTPAISPFVGNIYKGVCVSIVGELL